MYILAAGVLHLDKEREDVEEVGVPLLMEDLGKALPTRQFEMRNPPIIDWIKKTASGEGSIIDGGFQENLDNKVIRSQH